MAGGATTGRKTWRCWNGSATLLYGDGYTIKGVQKLLRQNGVKGVVGDGEAEGEAPKNPQGELDFEHPNTRARLKAVLRELEALRDLLHDPET